MGPNTKKSLVKSHPDISIERQCALLGLPVSSFYYKPAEKTPAQMERIERLQAGIDRWHTNMPFLGSRKLASKLIGEGLHTNRKEVRKIMDRMGIYSLYPKQNLSRRNKKHKVHPYLLRGKPIFIPNQVWAVDITYIKLRHGHMYLTAIIDWYSRYIVGWALSDTLDAAPVLESVKAAIDLHGAPSIINSDQGSQFTSDEYVEYLKEKNIRQSMDGKARWVDNVVIERWFRSLKWEDIYINEYNSPRELRRGIAAYNKAYNCQRPHQSLNYKTPEEIYYGVFNEQCIA